MYRAFAKINFTPRQVDDMRLWEAAVILGLDLAPDYSDDERYVGMHGDRPITAADAEKLARIQGANARDITQQVMGEMGIRTG